jgi:hypothetical protein
MAEPQISQRTEFREQYRANCEEHVEKVSFDRIPKKKKRGGCPKI